MDYLYEKVSYLKGLADGMDIEETTKEGKLLINIIDVLEDFADAIVDLDDDAEEIAEYIEAMDGDMTNIEDDLYEDDLFDDDEDIDFIGIECSSCNEEVYIDEDLLYEKDVDIVCPRCHESIDMESVKDCYCGHDCDDEE